MGMQADMVGVRLPENKLMIFCVAPNGKHIRRAFSDLFFWE